MSETTTSSGAGLSTTKIFIDGQAGTTGLDMRERLINLPRFELLEIEGADRKNNARRKELIDAADIAVLCLPDEAALCLLYTSPSPRDATLSRMPSSA